MIKIPNIFELEGGKATRRINHECDWVFLDKGTPFRMWDGIGTLVYDRELFRRDKIVAGRGGAPKHFIRWGSPVDGWQYGYRPVGRAKLFMGATRMVKYTPLPDGFYELVGPGIKGNPENTEKRFLTNYKRKIKIKQDRCWCGIKKFFSTVDIEGIVFVDRLTGFKAKTRKIDFFPTRSDIYA